MTNGEKLLRARELVSEIIYHLKKYLSCHLNTSDPLLQKETAIRFWPAILKAVPKKLIDEYNALPVDRPVEKWYSEQDKKALDRRVHFSPMESEEQIDAEPPLHDYDVKVLKYLLEMHPVLKGIEDVAAAADVSRPTARQIVDRLLDAGRVFRKSERSGVGLTDKGRALAKRLPALSELVR
jgi:DNA-binding MarR family transcriptional regulator